MLWVLGIGDGLAETRVAPGPSYILRGRGPPADHAAWVRSAWVGRLDCLDLDLVLPVVAEVIDVGECAADRGDPMEVYRCLINRRFAPALTIVDPVGRSANSKLVELVVPPPERGLQVLVKVSKRGVAVDSIRRQIGGRIPAMVTFNRWTVASRGISRSSISTR
ncbi:MAG: hypothetical protein NVS9B11_20030 [Candidatus Dormibacteraceae bacterium]